MIKKLAIWIGGLLALFIAIGVGVYLAYDKPLPTGQEGPEAEALADKMLEALNYEAYQKLNTIQWTFYRNHTFIWNKKDNIVTAKWDDYEITFSPENKSGTVLKNGTILEGPEKQTALQTAWQLYANDSFWLVAPFKVRDPGTRRYLVDTEEGPGLLVTYNGGGVTPGDSYLWILDEQNRPKAWRMWVNILPIGGLEFEWNNWKQYNGVWFASSHKGLVDVTVSDISVQ